MPPPLATSAIGAPSAAQHLDRRGIGMKRADDRTRDGPDRGGVGAEEIVRARVGAGDGAGARPPTQGRRSSAILVTQQHERVAEQVHDLGLDRARTGARGVDQLVPFARAARAAAT